MTSPAIRDYRNAEDVARILSVINPHGYDADRLVSEAQSQFYKDNRVTFFGTGGWYATFYAITGEHESYTHDCVFTLMPWAVEAYLIEKGLMPATEFKKREVA